MDRKEFFKPTKWKIILTLVIPFYLTYTVQFARAIPPDKSIWYQFVFYPIPILIAYFMLFSYSGAQPTSPSGTILNEPKIIILNPNFSFFK